MIRIGDNFSHKFSYSQQNVDDFARVSGDTNPLHIDEEAGRQSMFGRRIIHGFLGASVFTKIFGSLWYFDGHVYLNQSMKWLKPMFTDQEYEATIKVAEIFPEKNRIRYECEVRDVASGDTVIVGEATLMNKKQYIW